MDKTASFAEQHQATVNICQFLLRLIKCGQDKVWPLCVLHCYWCTLAKLLTVREAEPHRHLMLLALKLPLKSSNENL